MIATKEQLRKLKGIIYLIRNKINGKVYIGQSRRTFAKRYNLYKWWTKIDSKHLLNSINKYGSENFEIEILEYNKTDKQLNKLEKEYIKRYNSDTHKNGYNIKIGGNGAKFSKEYLEKLKQENNWTTDGFIEKAIHKHGNTFDYSLVKYVNFSTNVEIVCKTCLNHFQQRPAVHLIAKICCKNCNNNKLRNDRQKSKEFLDRAKEIHGNKFNYSEVNYINCDLPIKIKCNNCLGTFERNPYVHLKVKNCPLCNPKTNSKKIAQIDLNNGNIINVYDSIEKASKAVNLSKNSSSICRVAKGIRKSAGGYGWKYL